MALIRQQTDLDDGLAALCRADPEIARIVAAGARPQLRLRAPGFASLLRIIVGQQLSIASADAIWGRLMLAVDPLSPENLLAQPEACLRTTGLGPAKLDYARGLAVAVLDGTIDLAAVARMHADDAITHLTAQKGIGPWTAEIYLLFATGHPDIFPAGDLALREALRLMHDRDTRPDNREAMTLSAGWAPWRGVAARLLWDYYRLHKSGRDAMPA